MTKYAVHYNIKGVYCSVSTEQGQMIKQHTYIGFLGNHMEKMIHSMWELSLLSRSEHRDLAGLDTWSPEKDPELCAVRISVYLIWESLAPHLPLSRAQCNRNRMWQYHLSKFILIVQQSGMIKYLESKFEFTALWRGEIWHDLTLYGEKSISPSFYWSQRVLVSNLVTDKSSGVYILEFSRRQSPLLERQMQVISLRQVNPYPS